VFCDNKEMLDSMDVFANEFVGAYDLEVEALELHLHSDKYDYAGTCDFIGRVDGEKLVIDWKTSKAIYNTYPLQFSAYLHAYEELYAKRLDGAMVVCVRDSGIIYKKFSRDEWLDLFTSFVAACRLYKYVYG